MTFEQLAPELEACGVDFTVQVQSADNPEDTALMRASAADHPEVAGIVGFAPLDDADATAATLEAWAGDTLLVGVRNLIHNKPDPDWLLRPEVADFLGVLEQHGVPLDVVAVLPRHLELIPILSERHPDLRMVIDHLAKPPIGLDSTRAVELAHRCRRRESASVREGQRAVLGDEPTWGRGRPRRSARSSTGRRTCSARIV